MKQPDQEEKFVVELYSLSSENEVAIDFIYDTTPSLVQIGIGKTDPIRISENVLVGILDSISSDNVVGVVIPDVLHHRLVCVANYLVNMAKQNSIRIYYTKDGETGMDTGAYSVKTGILVEDVNLHRNGSSSKSFQPIRPKNAPAEVNDGIHENIFGSVSGIFMDMDAPSPINPHLPDTLRSEKILSPGFREIKPDMDPSDGLSDGFHEIRPDSEIPSGVSDGLVDIGDGVKIERREMWQEDSTRMERLGYLPIAQVIGAKTYPEQLGGGRI